jgi:hypothetical protein
MYKKSNEPIGLNNLLKNKKLHLFEAISNDMT